MRIGHRRIGSVATFFAGDHKPIPIVWDGAVASAAFGEGRIIPIVIVDTTNRPDVLSTFAAHGPDAGEVKRDWSRNLFFDRDKVKLILTFERPNRCVIVLQFDIASQGVLVEQILHSQGLFIRCGQQGDRIANTMTNPGVLVDVSFDEVFWDAWVDLYERAIYNRMRRGGLGRKDARDATDKFLTEWRGTFHRRMNFKNGPGNA